MRAGIYTRVSHDATGNARSVNEQEAECRAWCAREGWDIVHVWSDNDLSASQYARKARPDWAEAMTAVRRRDLDILVAWEPSRATRDIEVWVALRSACRQASVRLGLSGRTYDVANAEDAFQLDLLFALSARESGKTSERVLRAVRANAEKGMPHGKLLYGYRRVYDPASGALITQVPDEATAPIVREIVARLLGGETTYAVAVDLNRRGVPTPRNGPRWDLGQVKRTAVNPGYAGRRVHQGQVIGDAAWEALIPEADHYAVVARLTDPARGARRDSAVRHLLSGVALAVCGAPVRTLRNKSGTHSYACFADFCSARQAAPLEYFVARLAVARLQQPDILQLLSRRDDRSQEALATLGRLEAELEQAARMFRDGALTLMGYAKIEGPLVAKIDAAKKAVGSEVGSPLLVSVAGPEVENRWDGLSVAQRREVIRALMTVQLLPTGRGKRVFDPASVQVTWR